MTLHRVRQEDGVALFSVMAVLALLLLLAALTANTSLELSASSNTDRRAKRAFAAADAGVEAASASALSLGIAGESGCIVSTSYPGTPDPACTVVTPQPAQSLGNGATYSYVMTPTLAAGVACGGQITTPEPGQRCVTSTGTVGGVTRRVQALTKSTAVAGGPFQGLVALNGFTMLNASRLVCARGDEPGAIGTNGLVRIDNAAKLDGDNCPGQYKIGLAPAAPVPQRGNAATPRTIAFTRQSGPYELELDPAPWEAAEAAALAGTNANAILPQPSRGSWNRAANARILTVGNNGELTMPGGTYSFCQLTLQNAAEVRLAPGAKVRIYLDSPSRPGSSCAAPGADGGMALDNATDFNWNSSGGGNAIFSAQNGAAADNLEIFVWGRPGVDSDCYSPGSVSICNAANFAGKLFAPQSAFRLLNATRFVGALSAETVTLDNSAQLRTPPGLAEGGGASDSTFRRQSFTECQPTRPVAGDPESGC